MSLCGLWRRLRCRLGWHRWEPAGWEVDAPAAGSPDWMWKAWLFARVTTCAWCGKTDDLGAQIREEVLRLTTEEEPR